MMTAAAASLYPDFRVRELLADRFRPEFQAPSQDDWPKVDEAFGEFLAVDRKIRIPRHFAPSWLSAVERRIRLSVSRDGLANLDSKRLWLSQDIAAAATVYFRSVADLLQTEPYLYASLEGDLVAELRSHDRDVTVIISSQSVLMFSRPTGAALILRVDEMEPQVLRDWLAGLL